MATTKKKPAKRKKASSSRRPEARLVVLYRESGYMRVPNLNRREKEPRDYKKGYEIRIAADTLREIREIRKLLRQVDIQGGKPFKKHSRWIQPIYGKEEMREFKRWLREYR